MIKEWEIDMIRPAVFLDRDGVLTVEKSYVCSMEDMEIFPYAKQCIEALHKKGYWAIIITNQSAIGRGLLKEEELKRMNQRLTDEIGVDAVYYCPHWYSSNGVPSKYNKICDCRKPAIGLIKQAMEDFQIDFEKSWFVGDRAGDILTGEACGAKTVLLNSGYGIQALEQPVQPDYQYENLLEFVENIPC